MLFQFGVIYFFSAIFFLFAACSQAGLIPDELSTSESIGQIPSASTRINGMVGFVNPVTDANITAVNVTTPESPQIIGESASDSTGRFSLTDLNLSDGDSVMLIATGGRYIDAVSYKSIQMKENSLSGVWKIRNLSLLESIDLTPMTTLQSAFYECLLDSTGLAADPVDYNHAIFKSTFGLNLNTDPDALLEEGASTDTGASAHSLFNIAFSAMADQRKASSAIQILALFSDSLKENCDLLGPENKISGAYAFHADSFRKDYLDALANLNFMPEFSQLTGNVDVTDTVESIRSNSNILFEFSEYDL